MEQAVESLLLECLEPLGVDAMLEAAKAHVQSQEGQRAQWQQGVEAATYEVDLARRRYEAVDPANRLVARDLERRLEKALSEAEAVGAEAKSHIEALDTCLTGAEEERLRHYVRLSSTYQPEMADGERRCGVAADEVSSWHLTARSHARDGGRGRVSWGLAVSSGRTLDLGLGDGDDAVDEDTDGVLSLARRDGEGGVDAARGGEKVVVAGRIGLTEEHVGESPEPEGAIERARGGERAIDAGARDVHDVGRGADRVTLGDEAGERAIAGLEAQIEHRTRDVLALHLCGEVPDDAEEVARVGALWERAREALPLEDPNAVDDGAHRVSGDRESDVTLGVEKREVCEVSVE